MLNPTTLCSNYEEIKDEKEIPKNKCGSKLMLMVTILGIMLIYLILVRNNGVNEVTFQHNVEQEDLGRAKSPGLQQDGLQQDALNGFKQEDKFHDRTIDVNVGCDASLRVGYIEHVVRYQLNVTSQTQARAIMYTNLALLQAKVAIASANNVKLILFPEFALTGLQTTRAAIAYFLEQIPDANLGTSSTPCGNSAFSNRPILTNLSCMAKAYNIYINMNWGDYINCSNKTDSSCPSNGQYQYNTQIVFDNTGQVIAKYHKIHSFNEYEYNSPAINYSSGTYFTMYYGTDNSKSINIGLAICFDSMYAVPIWYLIKTYSINFFMISHWWVNADITSTATQWFASLSREYNINLVVASSGWYYWPYYPYSSSGSGIYSQGKVLSEYYNYNNNSNSTFNYADIPTILTGSSSQFTVTTIPSYLTATISPATIGFTKCNSSLGYAIPGTTLKASVSCPSFYCNATLKVSSLSSTYGSQQLWSMFGVEGYYDVADGNHVYYYEQICGVYCYTCGLTYLGYAQFDSINITGKFNNNSIPFVLMMQNYGFSYVNAVSKTNYTINNGKFSLNGSTYPDYVIDITVQNRVFSLDSYYSS